MKTKLPIIIPTCKIGRLGNALISGAHHLAFCLENDLYFTHLWFEEYANLFPSVRYSIFCSYPSFPWFPMPQKWRGWIFRIGQILKKVSHKKTNSSYEKILSEKQFNPNNNIKRVFMKIGKMDIGMDQEIRLDEPDFIKKISDFWIVNLKGWRYRAPNLVHKHREKIKKHFSPKSTICKSIKRKINLSKKGFDILVGLHLRQTDYQLWRDGEFFYSPEYYINLMNQFIKLHPNKKVKFLICSDELPQEINNCLIPWEKGLGTPIEDIYSLAECDYIMGPPSTFSLWASFYGSKPLCHIDKKEMIITLSDFAFSNNLSYKYD